MKEKIHKTNSWTLVLVLGKFQKKKYIYIYICGGRFCSWPPASLFVRFGEPSLHGIVCNRGTLMLVLSTYKAWVGCFSCRCETALKVFSCCLRTKPTRVTKLCGCRVRVRDMAKPIPPHPKANNTLNGHHP